MIDQFIVWGYPDTRRDKMKHSEQFDFLRGILGDSEAKLEINF